MRASLASEPVKTTAEIHRVRPALTFESKLVELSGQVVDHHPLAAGLPQPVHSVDEVRHHLVDGVGVRHDVFGLQHPRIQDAAYALPLGSHPARINGEGTATTQVKRIQVAAKCLSTGNTLADPVITCLQTSFTKIIHISESPTCLVPHGTTPNARNRSVISHSVTWIGVTRLAPPSGELNVNKFTSRDLCDRKNEIPM